MSFLSTLSALPEDQRKNASDAIPTCDSILQFLETWRKRDWDAAGLEQVKPLAKDLAGDLEKYPSTLKSDAAAPNAGLEQHARQASALLYRLKYETSLKRCVSEATQQVFETLPPWLTLDRHREINQHEHDAVQLRRLIEKAQALSTEEAWQLQIVCSSLEAEFLLMDNRLKGLIAALENTDIADGWQAIGCVENEQFEWKKVGLKIPEIAVSWKACGFSFNDAKSWRANNFIAEEAKCFRETGIFDAEQALMTRGLVRDTAGLFAWIRAGFAPDDILAWREAGAKNPMQAMLMRQKGRGPGSEETVVAKERPEESPASDEPGNESAKPEQESAPAEIVAAVVPPAIIRGDDPAETEPEVPMPVSSINPEHAEWAKLNISSEVEIQGWQEAGFEKPGDVLPWHEAAFSPATVTAWKKLGVTSVNTALWLQERGVNSFHTDAVRADPEACHLPGKNLDGCLMFFGITFDDADIHWKASDDENDPGAWYRRLVRLLPGDPHDRIGWALGRMDLPGGNHRWWAAVVESEMYCEIDMVRQIKVISARPSWMENFERFSKALELPGGDPTWQLWPMGQNKQAGLAWAAAYAPSNEIPWQESMDYTKNEDWKKRFSRRAEDCGEEESEPLFAPFQFKGPTGNSWLVAREESVCTTNGGEIKIAASGPDWKETFVDFSRIMDSPLKSATWILFNPVL